MECSIYVRICQCRKEKVGVTGYIGWGALHSWLSKVDLSTVMAEFRQRKIKDLVAPRLSLETEGHGKQHTLVGAGVVHAGGAWMRDGLAVQLSTATEEWAHEVLLP